MSSFPTRLSLSVVLAVATGHAVACNGIFDIGAFPRGTDSSVDPPFNYLSKPCGACVQSNCSGEEAACLEDDACRALNECLAHCVENEPDCRDDCRFSFPGDTETQAHLELEACKRELCFGSCIGDEGLVPAKADAECEACVAESEQCREATAACLKDSRCDAIVSCLTARCEDPDCVLECFYGGPGEAPDQALADLIDGLERCWRDCPTCGVGQDMACVGEFPWSSATSKRVAVSVRVEVFPDLPAEGVSVAACTDRDCLLPEQETVVGADGRADFDLYAGLYGWKGYLRFTGKSVLDTEIYPTRFYFGRPITRDENRVGLSLLSRAAAVLVGSQLGQPLVEGRAHLAVLPWDCLFQWAQGVRFEPEGIVDGTVAFYRSDDGTGFLIDDGSLVTTTEGGAGFINLQPSDEPSRLRVIEPADGDRVITDTEIWLRPDELTTIYTFPDPTDE